MALQKFILVIGLSSLLLSSLLLSSLSAQVQPPPGWRFPNKNDVKDDWEAYKSPAHVVADFNGDGLQDEAWILLRQNNQGWGVFVFLGTKQGAPQIIKLVAPPQAWPAQRFGISLAQPSRKNWKTVCGKGYYVCKPGEPEEIQITLPSIEFCYIDSACSVYMWNVKANAFSKYQMSD